MKKRTQNILIIGTVAVVGYMAYKQGIFGDVRRDVAKGNRWVNNATGGAVPVVDGILPTSPSMPGFGVQFGLDPILTTEPGMMYAGGSPGFYSGGANSAPFTPPPYEKASFFG